MTNQAKARELLLAHVISFVEHDVAQQMSSTCSGCASMSVQILSMSICNYCRLTRVACLMITLNFLSRLQTYMSWGT